MSHNVHLPVCFPQYKVDACGVLSVTEMLFSIKLEKNGLVHQLGKWNCIMGPFGNFRKLRIVLEFG